MGQASLNERGVARKYLPSDVASDSDALNVDNDIVDVPLSHHRPGASNECGVARKYPLSDVAVIATH